MKRVLQTVALALIFGTLLAAFSSCAALKKPEDEVIRQRIGELLPLAYDAAYLLYGPGAEIDESFVIDPTWTTDHYAQVSSEYKYQKAEDLWLLFIAAFSKARALEMFEYAFEGTEDMRSRYGSTKNRLTREYALELYDYIKGEKKQAPAPLDAKNDGKLTVNVSVSPLYELKTTYYPETAHVVKGTSTACYVEIGFSVDGGATIEKTQLKLVKEYDQWLFDVNVY